MARSSVRLAWPGRGFFLGVRLYQLKPPHLALRMYCLSGRFVLFSHLTYRNWNYLPQYSLSLNISHSALIAYLITAFYASPFEFHRMLNQNPLLPFSDHAGSPRKDMARMNKGLAFLLLLVTSTSLQANESSWLTNYGDAMKLARTTARPLLLVIHRDDRLPASSDRSSPGQAAQPSQDLLNAYVLCKIDANSGYGKRVAEAFRVTEFPHSVIIDKTTKKILVSKPGQATDETWKVTLTKYQGEAPLQAVAATRPQTTFRTQPQATIRTQPQMTFWNQSRASGRTNYFRQPAVCNT